MHRIAESETGMAAENNAGLPVVITESFCVRGRKMFQAGILHEESVRERFLWKINFVLLICREPRIVNDNNKQGKTGI